MVLVFKDWIFNFYSYNCYTKKRWQVLIVSCITIVFIHYNYLSYKISLVKLGHIVIGLGPKITKGNRTQILKKWKKKKEKKKGFWEIFMNTLRQYCRFQLYPIHRIMPNVNMQMDISMSIEEADYNTQQSI